MAVLSWVLIKLVNPCARGNNGWGNKLVELVNKLKESSITKIHQTTIHVLDVMRKTNLPATGS